MHHWINALIFSLIAFGIYKLWKRRSKHSVNQQTLSELEFKPYLETLDLDREEKIRKQWLTSFFAFTAVSALFFFLAFLPLFNDFSDNAKRALIVLAGILPVWLGLSIWSWITYHCSYKKRGTAWLMWTMITLPLGELSNITKSQWGHPAEWNYLGWLIMLTYLAKLGIGLFFWIKCLRLRRVNADRKYQRIAALKAKYGEGANVPSSQ